MQNQNEREVVLAEPSEDVAVRVLKESEEGIDVGDAVVQYATAVLPMFAAKYGLNGRNLIISFFPRLEYLELAEMPVPVHPLEQQKKWSENPEMFHRYQRLLEMTQQHWSKPNTPILWMNVFPKVLNEVAQAHFNATSPRLQAKYTAELKSWWLRAQGFDHLTFLDRYVEQFLEKMNVGFQSLQT